MGLFSFFSMNHHVNNAVKRSIAEDAAKTFRNCLLTAIKEDALSFDLSVWRPPLGEYGSLTDYVDKALIPKIMDGLQKFKLEGGDAAIVDSQRIKYRDTTLDDTMYYGQQIGVQLFAKMAGLKIDVMAPEAKALERMNAKPEKEIKTTAGYEDARNVIQRSIAVKNNTDSLGSGDGAIKEQLDANLHGLLKQSFPFMAQTPSRNVVTPAAQNTISGPDIANIVFNTMGVCVAKAKVMQQNNRDKVAAYPAGATPPPHTSTRVGGVAAVAPHNSQQH